LTIHWWKPTRRSLRVCNERTIFNNGYFDEDIEKKRTVFTKYGMVFIAAIKHNDRIFASSNEDLNYFTHYAMIHNGKLWRCRSWGGGFEPKSYTFRAYKFARMVMRLAQDEANAQPVSPSKQAELEIVRLKDGLQRLVDYVFSLMQSALPRIGIVWSSPDDYPLALRNALRLLESGGDTRKED
jgi:hypothetical protein